MNDDLFDPYEQALIWSDSDVGIIVTADEQMHLVAITDRVVTDCVGTPVDTFTAGAGLVFWFGPADSGPAVNRMATLNLFAAAAMSARVVPLLHGPVLITGVDQAGKPLGLSRRNLSCSNPARARTGGQEQSSKRESTARSSDAAALWAAK